MLKLALIYLLNLIPVYPCPESGLYRVGDFIKNDSIGYVAFCKNDDYSCLNQCIKDDFCMDIVNF